MPATLTTPETVNETISEFRIGSHAFNHDNGTAVIMYHKGSITDNNFVPVLTNIPMNVPAADLQVLVVRVNEIVSGQETVDIYGAEKQALYEYLLAELGVDASID